MKKLLIFLVFLLLIGCYPPYKKEYPYSRQLTSSSWILQTDSVTIFLIAVDGNGQIKRITKLK